MTMISPKLRVTMVQPNLSWEDKSHNLGALNELIKPLQGNTDLIVLPEMFSTGFSMNAEKLAEKEDGESVQWMKDRAKELNAVITGSLIIEDAGRYYNRLFWMLPNGAYQTYSKKHLFSFANEERHYTAGDERIIVEWNGWRICPLICYDLRFPVWSRNTSLAGENTDHVYDLLLYVANWPAARRRPWMNLLEARAHENQAYVVGVNRVGEDGNGIPHSGDSKVFNPKGGLLGEVEEYQVGTETIELDLSRLQEFRDKFTAWKDKDPFRMIE